MTNKKEQYHATKTRPLVQLVARIIKNHPEQADNIDYIMACLGQSIPGFHDKSKCVNCGASMAEYTFIFDVLDAILLFDMAKIVKERLDQYGDFTAANKVRIQDMLGTSYAVKSRTTQCAKLGLVAKYKEDDKHVPGTWVITRRGWEALKGIPVPRCVRVFRGQILERTDEKITITQAFSNYAGDMERKKKKGNKIRSDHTDDIKGYDENEWVHVAGMHPGEII